MTHNGSYHREDALEYNHLRARILANAPILHGASPRVLHHGYTVITSRETSFGSGDRVQATLAAYSGPSGSTEGILLRKTGMKNRRVDALRDLLEGMEQDIGLYLHSSVVGGKVGYPSEIPDCDRTPTAKNSQTNVGQHFPASSYFPGSSLPRTPSPPLNTLESRLAWKEQPTPPAIQRTRSTPVVIPAIFREQPKATGHHHGDLVESLPAVSPLAYRPYRKPLSPIYRDGYEPYRKPIQVEPRLMSPTKDHRKPSQRRGLP
ncbi:hypothetical protein BDV95DRAFT_596669 [Massariosphaeria phaeospora]|uniref:Uncharacterized protein n=1 Tax=Massariosphaeria phaeospora TaxID=100035 RepID=A0A7C8I600_9PLEO|nr:hypothetical protein BDV95DRAFT_596669 [Massariosphaeria phaeospora]